MIFWENSGCNNNVIISLTFISRIWTGIPKEILITQIDENLLQSAGMMSMMYQLVINNMGVYNVLTMLNKLLYENWEYRRNQKNVFCWCLFSWTQDYVFYFNLNIYHHPIILFTRRIEVFEWNSERFSRWVASIL